MFLTWRKYGRSGKTFVCTWTCWAHSQWRLWKTWAAHFTYFFFIFFFCSSIDIMKSFNLCQCQFCKKIKSIFRFRVFFPHWINKRRKKSAVHTITQSYRWSLYNWQWKSISITAQCSLLQYTQHVFLMKFTFYSRRFHFTITWTPLCLQSVVGASSFSLSSCNSI